MTKCQKTACTKSIAEHYTPIYMHLGDMTFDPYV